MFQLHIVLDQGGLLDYVVPLAAALTATAAIWTVIVARTIARNQNNLQTTLAGRQEQLQERQLRKDLYDRRFKVFTDTGDFIRPVLSSPTAFCPQSDEYRRFEETMQHATFLFGTEVRAYLEDVRGTTVGVWASYQKMTKDRGDNRDIEENAEKFQHLSDLWQKRPEVFHREVSLV